MDKTIRYLYLAKCGHFGLTLPRGSITNYLKIHRGKMNEYVGRDGSGFPLVSIMAAMRCNLNCSFCICGNFPNNWRDYEMTPKLMEKILSMDAVKRALMIVFTGGEPTLNPDLPKLMSMSRKEKHLVGMISNGTLLDTMAGDLAKAGLCDAQISIYENTRDKLADILPKATKHFAVNASYVLLKSKLYESSKQDFADLIDTVRMCKESGGSSLKFNLYQASEKLSEQDNDSETIKRDDPVYKEFIAACKRKLKGTHFTGHDCKEGLPSFRFTVFFPSPGSPQEENPTGAAVTRHCRLPWTLGTFNAVGNYNLCCGASIEPEINDLFTHGESIINSEKACRIRKCLIDESVPLAPECANCVYLAGSYISDL